MDFKKTSLCRSFQKVPLEYIDIGAAGEVHSLIAPFAALSNCTSFEPSLDEREKLKKKLAKDNPFNEVTVLDVAIGEKSGRRAFYIAKNSVNSSIYQPNDELIKRYGIQGLNIKKTVSIRMESLDNIVFGKRNETNKRLGEYIKIDCQGALNNVLKGAKRTIARRCVAVACELEFFNVYKNKNRFTESDEFLNRYGFRLYGLYPHYVSARNIDRFKYETEERFLWADALYFKDPLDHSNKKMHFSKRDIETLLIVAIINGYYDFVFEIMDRFYSKNGSEIKRIKELVLSLAAKQKEAFEADLNKLIRKAKKSSRNSYILAKKFIDKYKANNIVDFIRI
ncbi:MAG: FkbM family methyltransferase [Candidatus Omnitrophica bacterium]|nr:FkbM family methyltransferase [Candidatus Omnitrophota bacterium]